MSTLLRTECIVLAVAGLILGILGTVADAAIPPAQFLADVQPTNAAYPFGIATGVSIPHKLIGRRMDLSESRTKFFVGVVVLASIAGFTMMVVSDVPILRIAP